MGLYSQSGDSSTIYSPKSISKNSSSKLFSKNNILKPGRSKTIFSNPIWREIGPKERPGGPGSIRMRGTGRLVFIVFDKENNRIFTGSPLGGLWFSEDSGKSWQNGGTDYLPEIGVSHMQVAPNTNLGNTWFIATGDGDAAFNPSNGIWRTTNGGGSWEAINFGLDIGLNFPPPFWSRCRKILVHPKNGNILFAAFRHGIYKTENALVKDPRNVVWERVADNSLMKEYFDIAFKPGSEAELVIASGTKVAISNSKGNKNSFQLIPNYESLGKHNNELISLRVSEDKPDLIYGAYKGNIFSYSISNQTSKNKRVGNRYSRSQAFAISPFNGDEYVFGNIQGLYLTEDAGKSIQKKPDEGFAFHDDIHFLEYRDSNEIWMANDGGICRSADKGDTWEDLSYNIGAAVYYNIGISEKRPDLIIGGGWDTGPNIYFAKRDTFQTFNIFGDAFESLIDDTDPDQPKYFVSIQSGMARFDNSLVDVEFMSKPGPRIKGKRNWTHEFVKDPNFQNILYYSGMPAVGRSFDGGHNWENIIPNPQLENSKRYFDGIWHSPRESGYLYVLQNSKDADDKDALVIWKSSNANTPNAQDVKWEKIPIESWAFKAEISKEYSLTDLCIHPEDPSHIWVCLNSYEDNIPKILEYDGKKWKSVSSKGLEAVKVSRLIAQKNSDGRIYIGSHSGVYYKDLDSKRWSKIFGLPHAKVTDMEINNCAGILRVSTLGRGIWECDLIQGQKSHRIKTDLTINKDSLIEGSLIIESGVQLKVNSHLYFEKHGEIILEKGAQLVLDGAVLQSYCRGKWAGIWLEGSYSWPKDFHKLDQLKILNGARIEDLEY